MDDIDPIITPEERQLLLSVLGDMERDTSAEEENWLCQYTVARSFIHSLTNHGPVISS